jgi:hypothetical protein
LGGRTGLVGLWLVEGVTVQENERAGGYVVVNKAAHCYYHDSLFYKRFLDEDIKIKNINYHSLFIDSFYLPYAYFIHLYYFIYLMPILFIFTILLPIYSLPILFFIYRNHISQLGLIFKPR